MIEKLISIKALGKFANWSAAGDLTFKKLTLIYGENGQGKSTISALLRSLKKAEATTVAERKKLSTKEQPSISLRADGQNYDFKNGQWNRAYEKLRVFDSTFVESNVYSGERIETEHRRNLFVVVIGEESVALVDAVHKVQKTIDALTPKITAKEGEIKGHLPDGILLNKFIALPKIEGLQETTVKAINRVGAIEQQGQFVKLSIPKAIIFTNPTETELMELLSSSVKTISDKTLQMVIAHMKQRKMDSKGEKWIKQGRNYVLDGECPYCGQELTSIELVKAYDGYFSTEYQDLSGRIATLTDKFTGDTSDASLLGIRKCFDENRVAYDGWKNFLSEVTQPEFNIDLFEKIVKEARNVVAGLLATKRDSPLTEIEPDEALQSALNKLSECVKTVSKYNEHVDKYIKAIDTLKTATSKDSLPSAKQQLFGLEATAKRHLPAVTKLVGEHKVLKDEKAKLDAHKEKAKKALDEKSTELISKYQGAINKFLERCGAEFKVVKAKRTYIGKIPNVTYALEVDGTRVPLSGSQGIASFCNTLSAGDKTTLAFAFFLATLEDIDNSKTVVIIDDPISSLDSFRELHTACMIMDLAVKAEQVVLLSHYPAFLYRVHDENRNGQVKCLEIRRLADGSAIAEWDIERASRTDYERNWWVLTEYLDKGAIGDRIDIAKCIRPLLEDYLRYRLPGVFPKGKWLGEQIEMIRNAKSESPFTQMKPYLKELEELNDFCKVFHHGQGSAPLISSKIQDSTLKNYAKRAKNLIGGNGTNKEQISTT